MFRRYRVESLWSPVATLALIAVLLSPTPAAAQGYAWMQNSPVRSFTEQDWLMLREMLKGLLDTGEVGASASWENPESTNSGAAKVVELTEIEGKPCRRARITNNGGGLSSTGTFRLCKNEAEEWVFAP